MSLSGSTRVFGLLGDPVDHSLSPFMQNRAFQKYRIDAVYVPFHVVPAALPDAVAGIRSLNIAGVNVTVPHKETIIPLLDEIDQEALLIGAVNTVVNREGVLVGHNTDASGFIRSLREVADFAPQGKDVLLLGAGGAGRAALVALANSGAKTIMIANRSPGRAESLLKSFSSHFFETHLCSTHYETSDYTDFLSRAELVVNTTSAGLKGEQIKFFTIGAH